MCMSYLIEIIPLVLNVICHHVCVMCGGNYPSGSKYYLIIIIIMVIFKCYFSGAHIALSFKKQWCEHRIMKNQQIKGTVHDAN